MPIPRSSAFFSFSLIISWVRGSGGASTGTGASWEGCGKDALSLLKASSRSTDCSKITEIHYGTSNGKVQVTETTERAELLWVSKHKYPKRPYLFAMYKNCSTKPVYQLFWLGVLPQLLMPEFCCQFFLPNLASRLFNSSVLKL